ncbi:SURF1 family protein [Sphingomonas sp. MMS24-JH45]
MRRVAALAGAFAAIVVLIGLGLWQVERLQGKRALIAQVGARLAAPAVAAPRRTVGPRSARTTPIPACQVTGRWRGPDTLVQAVTDLGGGFWVMTPFTTREGWTLLVNRGFVPAGARAQPPAGNRVAGLLRTTEPGGAFLRDNDPAAGRWYSRDVAAIAAARGVGRTASYFVDADTGATGGWPRGGMTVVRFANNHLVYALTWFALAGLVGFLVWRVQRR